MFFVTCFEKFLNCPVVILLAFRNDPIQLQSRWILEKLSGYTRVSLGFDNF